MHSFVIINGCGGSGKDTFVDLCIKYGNQHKFNVINYSSVSSSKDIMEFVSSRYLDVFQSVSNKDFSYRDTLVDIKDYLDNRYNAYLKDLYYELDSSTKYSKYCDTLTFIHSREPKKIDRIIKYLKTCGSLMFSDRHDSIGTIKTLLVVGRTDPENFTNHADREVLDYNYDITIENTGTLDNLEQQAKKFMRWYIPNTL